MIKGFKIRLYPTKEQEKLIWEHIYGCRYVWNYMLALQKERYKNNQKYLSSYDMSNLLPLLKNDGEHDWLKKIGARSQQIICQDLDKAYQMFFKKNNNCPKFKTKKQAYNSFPIDQESLWFDDKNKAHISKIGKVKFKTDFRLPIGRNNKYTNGRVILINQKWYLTFGMEIRDNTPCFNQ